jgi:adenylate cyclase, class 2
LAIEIELKTHVKNCEALRLVLAKKARYVCSFEKEDTYYFTVGNSDIPKSGVRLRSEKKSFPDGTEKKAVYVTYKTKEARNGIEINDEKEFEVSSLQDSTITILDGFFKLMGLRPGYSKRKRGWAFSKEEINAELLEVEKLGWFLEMEIIVNDIEIFDNKENIIDKKRKQLIDFLSEVGIEKNAIECRYYSEMLKELTGSAPIV